MRSERREDGNLQPYSMSNGLLDACMSRTMDQIDVSSAKTSIEKMLLGAGGSALIRAGNTLRILSHSSLVDRPLTTLPWPLSLLQRHSVRFVLYQNSKKVEEETFSKHQIPAAIESFLNGVGPNEKVLLMPDHER